MDKELWSIALDGLDDRLIAEAAQLPRPRGKGPRWVWGVAAAAVLGVCLWFAAGKEPAREQAAVTVPVDGLSAEIVYCADGTVASVTVDNEYAPTPADEYYAYLDLDTAPEELHEQILAARNRIIFSRSWTAEGCSGYIVDVERGEIVETVPGFYDIFPADWEIPRYDDVATLTPPETMAEEEAPVLVPLETGN